jgi:EAL domain-containing protein (putative c-di-GMP-specific phosphodiesterase class I)
VLSGEKRKTFTLAVNFSLSRFRSRDLVNSIGRTLTATGLMADRLEIEITEQVLHDNPDESLKTLRQLHDLGVRVVLDDFGAGFSSLTYLRQFPFHKIKIDRSFVAGLSEDAESRVIIRTLARLGTRLRIATAAEGVETNEQLDIVRAEGCTEMQGHYFSAPKTAEEIGRLLLKPLGKVDAVA